MNNVLKLANEVSAAPQRYLSQIAKVSCFHIDRHRGQVALLLTMMNS
jgi:hypothetical protein